MKRNIISIKLEYKIWKYEILLYFERNIALCLDFVGFFLTNTLPTNLWKPSCSLFIVLNVKFDITVVFQLYVLDREEENLLLISLQQFYFGNKISDVKFPYVSTHFTIFSSHTVTRSINIYFWEGSFHKLLSMPKNDNWYMLLFLHLFI